VAFVACWHFVEPAIRWLAHPVGTFYFSTPYEAFMCRIQVAGAMAVAVAFPIAAFQLWKFIEVALEANERKMALSILPASCALFYFGGLLAVFGVVPIGAKMLLQFGGPVLHPLISLDSYLSFVIWMAIGFGVFFQVPVAVVVLSRLGLINPHKLSNYRSHAIVATLIIAAVLTPGPDVISQMMLAIPAYTLFEVSLIIARRVARPPKS